MRYLALLLVSAIPVLAQDSVDVTFRYTIAGKTGISLPGEFNGWNNTAWPMTNAGGNLYIRTARLRVGGNPSPPPSGIPGAWQFKFYYSGASPWPNDPLDHHVNNRDNDNSYIIVKDPTIYQLLPNQRDPIVNSSTPTVSAYIFPKQGSSVDTSSVAIQIDGTLYPGLGQHYNFITQQFTYAVTLPNGNHTLILYAGTNSDTTTFTSRGGFVQLQNQSPFTTVKSQWTLNGIVDDSIATSVRIVRNGVDTFTTSVTNTAFSASVALAEGANSFIALADSSGSTKISSPVSFIRKVNHNPLAAITLGDTSGGVITLSGISSADPDSGQTANLGYQWSADPGNPSATPGVQGAVTRDVSFVRPAAEGEYFFTLIASDPDGHRDTARAFFRVNPDNSVDGPSGETNPSWARSARIYFLFPKAVSQSGTLSAAALRLPVIRDMGFSVIWLMPVMKNAFPIDNNFGTGYNIVDFYTVAPEYGTNQDLKNFVDQAHSLGLKIILDITPNHSSRFHPWSSDAHTYKMNSVYWNWYEHAEITANTNGLGDCLDADGFNYYCGFSDQLLNLNWKDADLQAEMIKILTYWIATSGVDGYRFDVYWGPHRRYGEAFMGSPVRNALKHIKPDILLLAEDDGTGGGSEVIYADNVSSGVHGGVDAAYDFKLYFSDVRNFGFSPSAMNNLHTDLDNGGFYPGANSLFMRFLESQDEDRIYYYNNSPSTYYDPTPSVAFQKTLPMASVIFTSPGIPMVWNGQEVGWGYGIPGSREARSRSVIDWNYQGKAILAPAYQRLANIRGQFPAFRQHKPDTNHDGHVDSQDAPDFVRVASSNASVYSFLRPWRDQNGLSVVNFSGATQPCVLNLLATGALTFSGGVQPGSSYYLNDLSSNTSVSLLGSTLDSVGVSLPPYGAAVFTVSATLDSVIISNPVSAVQEGRHRPEKFVLAQNFPNPFNPSTSVSYSVPIRSAVRLRVFDALGREVATLAGGVHQPGTYVARWTPANGVASGVYFCRMETERGSIVNKMLLLR